MPGGGSAGRGRVIGASCPSLTRDAISAAAASVPAPKPSFLPLPLRDAREPSVEVRPQRGPRWREEVTQHVVGGSCGGHGGGRLSGGPRLPKRRVAAALDRHDRVVNGRRHQTEVQLRHRRGFMRPTAMVRKAISFQARTTPDPGRRADRRGELPLRGQVRGGGAGRSRRRCRGGVREWSEPRSIPICIVGRRLSSREAQPTRLSGRGRSRPVRVPTTSPVDTSHRIRGARRPGGRRGGPCSARWPGRSRHPRTGPASRERPTSRAARARRYALHTVAIRNRPDQSRRTLDQIRGAHLPGQATCTGPAAGSPPSCPGR
jgi:hypothetical protein